MSLLLTSDNSSLYWITDGGKIKSNQGLLNISDTLDQVRWKGVSVLNERLLVWTDECLYLFHKGSNEVKLLHECYDTCIERAAWSDVTIVEFFLHDTQGHPTDRSGYREQIDIKTNITTQRSLRQGIAPPWGSVGYISNHKDVCSNQNGIVLREWVKSNYQFYWKKIGRGGRRKLPMELNDYYYFRLLDNNGIIYVCGFIQNKLILIDIKGDFLFLHKELSQIINDVCFHNNELIVAMKGRSPECFSNYSNEKF